MVSIQEACDEILGRLPQIAPSVATRIRKEEPNYVSLMSFDELVDVNIRNLESFLLSVKFGRISGLETPYRTGLERAEQGADLSMVLHAFRMGAVTVWDELVQLTGPEEPGHQEMFATAKQLFETLDRFSQELTRAYRTVRTEQLTRDVRLRNAALDSLFTSSPTLNQRVEDISFGLRLPLTGRFVVAATNQHGNERETSLADALNTHGIRSAWKLGTAGELGILVLSESLAMEELAEIFKRIATGQVGISDPYSEIVDTHIAAKQATLALEVGRSGDHEVIRFDSARLIEILYSSPELTSHFVQRTFGELNKLAVKDRRILLETVAEWYRANGSYSAAGRRLHCHPNTVRYRLRKFSALTGRQFDNPIDIAHVHIAIEADRIGL